VRVHAEAAEAGDFVGEVAVALLLELGPAAVVAHDLLAEAQRAFRGDDGEVARRDDRVDAEQRGGAHHDVDVRSLGRDRVSKDVVE
jgi:hypothetical protein